MTTRCVWWRFDLQLTFCSSTLSSPSLYWFGGTHPFSWPSDILNNHNGPISVVCKVNIFMSFHCIWFSDHSVMAFWACSTSLGTITVVLILLPFINKPKIIKNLFISSKASATVQALKVCPVWPRGLSSWGILLVRYAEGSWWELKARNSAVQLCASSLELCNWSSKQH